VNKRSGRKDKRPRGAKPARGGNVVSIAPTIERRQIAEARSQLGHERALDQLDRRAALEESLEGIDFDAELARLRTFPPEQAAKSIGECRSARALKSCLHGDVAAGFAEWAEVIAEMPTLGRPYELRAAFLSGRDDKAALGDLDRAIAISPENKTLYRNRGLAYRHLGDHARATANFRRVVALDPRDVEGHLELGEELLQTGQHHAAVQSFTRAIALDPSHVDGYRGRAKALFAKRDLAAAIGDLDMMLRFDPEDAEARFARGQCHEFAGHTELAIADLEELAELGPTKPLVYDTLGRLYLESHQFQLAVHVFSRAIEIDPNHAAAIGGRANAYLGIGDGDRARVDARRAAELAPNDPAFALSRAVMDTLGEPPEAVRAAIDAVIRRFPSFAAAREYRSLL
jgi:tetratricopeptide (TPR) repeat protein